MAEETSMIESKIEKEIQSSYLDYAMSVIIGRALPEARDGLKPAQRRILYAMYMLGNTHDKPTKKSARIIGDTIGRYHPHGDIAAYETLVRMAQDFSLNHALVEGQGNFGSRDSDPAAAQRYTEVRLNKLAEELLTDLDKKAVKFVPNFDNTEEEPTVLPAKVPNLLLNGAAGIAVGVATSILPHNLREICSAINAYIDNKDITPQELLNYIKGPDFPTGGIIFYNTALHNSYLTGRGSCTIRGKTETEENKGKKSIVIKEIPYLLNKATLVQDIAELAKNKKIVGISDLRDESGKEGIRIVIDLRKEANAESILNTLYTSTSLQTTIPVINNAVLKNTLVSLNIKQFIKIFVEHRLDVIKNRTVYDLDVASERLHIVEGLLIALANISDVVAKIRKSADTKEARAALMGTYKLTEKQANAILDMKLSKLTSLEAGAMQTEGTDLTDKIKSYRNILEHESAAYQIIKEETMEISQKYGRERHTAIEQHGEIEEIVHEDTIADEETTIILTKSNYMKRMPTRTYKSQGRGGKGVIAIELREGDFVRQVTSCMSKDYLMLFTNKGRAYWLKAYLVPEEGRYAHGKAVVNLVQLSEGETVENIIATREFKDSYLTFITRRGTIKRVPAARFSNPRSNGIIAIPISDGDSLADVCVSDGKLNLFIATKNGKGLRFEETGVRAMGRAAHGVRGIRLSQTDQVVNVLPAKETDLIASVTENGYGKVTELKEYRLQGRGGKGVINLKVKDKTGPVVRALKVDNHKQLLLINSKGLSIEFPISEIRVTGRSASGVRLMRLEGGVKVVDAKEI
jgi:DNA gyrase subunit A